MLRQLLGNIAPWTKFIMPLLILTLVASLAWQTNQLNHKKDQLNVEYSQRHELSLIVHAEDNWESIRTHSRDIVQSNANLNEAIVRISRETLDAKRRADEADAALAREQSENAKRFSAAQRTIQQLEARKPTGTADGDRAAIDEDSKAAWKGWHMAARTQDINWSKFDPEYYTPVLAIRLAPETSLVALRQKYLEVTRINPLKIDGYVLYGFSETENGVCTVHVIDPRIAWTASFREIFGHELAHCFFGNWHRNTKGAL